MVLYFTSNVVDPPALLYMGKDKFENEELIKYGFEEDVWFHVDKMSSAHVYLRLNPGQTWDNIPEPLLQDIAQLTKANSIEGNKKNNIIVIYTPWSNLKKTPGMETGQVTFHKQNVVKRIHVEKRQNDIINRLNKTKEEKFPDLAAEKVKRQRDSRKELRVLEKQQQEEERRLAEEKRKQEELKSYKGVFDTKQMKSNRDLFSVEADEEGGDLDTVNAYEEDFM
ncbi:Coiled-coil domain-containing protein 25 [Quaeritorhiza haematococci]|nr:Coiled-coil domain-containing protein 25 [Quaeritorhiza haematococci]